MKCFAVAVLVLFWWLVCEKVQAKDSLVIGYTAIAGIKAELWVAENVGIFDKHNIQAELLLVTSASKMVQAMLGGDVLFEAAVAPNAAVYTAEAKEFSPACHWKERGLQPVTKPTRSTTESRCTPLIFLRAKRSRRRARKNCWMRCRNTDHAQPGILAFRCERYSRPFENSTRTLCFNG